MSRAPSVESPVGRARTGRSRFVIGSATPADRERIYQLRHTVYASELGQHPQNIDGRLTDPLDAYNAYIVAHSGEELVYERSGLQGTDMTAQSGAVTDVLMQATVNELRDRCDAQWSARLDRFGA